jgi:hypothetical protein
VKVTLLQRIRLGRRTPSVLVCVAVATLAAMASVTHLSLFPPSFGGARHLEVAGAATQILVDRRRSPLADRLAQTGDFVSLGSRSTLLAQLMTSAPVRAEIARHAGVPPAELSGVSPVTSNAPAVFNEPDFERRADQIFRSGAPYQLNVQANPVIPGMSVYAQAPTVAEAQRLADAAAPAMRAYLRRQALANGTDPRNQVTFEQIGPARGSVLNPGAAIEIGVFTFIVALAVCGFALALVRRGRLGWKAAAPELPADEPGGGGAPSGSPARDDRPQRPLWDTPRPAGGGSALAVAPAPAPTVLAPTLHSVTRTAVSAGRAAATRAGDWPRTTRLLPWMLAGFMAVIWLVPFNTIQLTASLPIDLKFDRLILPGIVFAWVLALAAGGRGAPRLRVTGVHIALAAFVGCACLSLVLNAQALNHTLEFDRGLKKLTLILSYLSVFVMLASVIRRTEVRAFLNYTLGLAVVCALGTIWEYRFKYNIFYGLSDQILPGIFSVGTAEPGVADQIGRRLVRGPAEIPLETVAMLTLGLPIALVGVLDSPRTKQRVIYGIAACLLLAAAISTYRKSAFMAPIAVVLTLACFRRRHLLRLAPLGVVGLAAVHVLSPGAFGSIVYQLRGDRLGVSTVSDRSSDYDAVRPDIWAHLAFGRGFGTYDHDIYRILDMELLGRLVQGGILGLASYLFVIGAVVAIGRRVVATGDPAITAVGLVAVSAAVGMLVLSTLFDAMSFPHCPYIFLFLAAFVAVVAKPATGGVPPPAGAG